MRKTFKVFLAGAALLAICAVGRAMVAKYTAYLVNETGLAYNNTYPLNLNSYQIDSVAFTTIASSVTFASKTFTDGQQSTGTITVTSNALSTASASAYMTVVSTTLLHALGSSAVITVNGVPIQNQVQWFDDVTASNTALGIVTAINKYILGVTASTGTPIGNTATVFSTATVGGSYGNNMTFSINFTTNAIRFGTYISSAANSAVANFSGGTDGTMVVVNGKSYQAGYDFAIGAAAANSATNLAAAITASSATYGVNAAAAGAIVFATSTTVGLNTNYVISTSSQTLLTVGGSTFQVTGLNGRAIGQMWGGTDASYSLVGGSSTVIGIPNHGFTLALPVLYGSAVTLSGLTSQTTYYVIPINSNAISLAKTSTAAIAGVPIVLTSSLTKTAADTFTMTALASTGIPSYRLEVSNDGSQWMPYTLNADGVTISSVSIGTYFSTGTITTWDLGEVGYSWMRMSVVAPTTGAIKIQSSVNGKNTAQ